MPPINQAPALILPGGNVIEDFRGPSAGPHDHVAHVTTRISIRSFFLLLVGTVVIFGLTILVWHLGSFFRRFSRAKVVGEKEDGQARRYAKTWHGWVDLEKYEERQRKKRKWADRVLVVVGLKGSRAHGRGVWEVEKGDGNCGSDHAARASYADDTVVRSSPDKAADASFKIDIDELIRPIRGRVYRPTSNEGPDASTRRQFLPKPTFRSLRRPLSAVGNNRFESLCKTSQQKKHEEHSPQPPSSHQNPPKASAFVTARKHSQSMPSLVAETDSNSSIRAHSVKTHASESDQEALKNESTAVIPRKRPLIATRARQLKAVASTSRNKRRRTASSFFALARQYQIWGAKMQLKPFAKDPPYLIGLAGRPGTPVPSALRGMTRSGKGGLTWSSSKWDESVELTPDSSVYYKLSDTVIDLPSPEKRLDVPRVIAISTDLSLLGDANMDLTPTSRREDKGKDRASPTSIAITPRHPSSKTRRHRSSTDPGSTIKNHVKELSRAEVHLLFNLGKKLEWLCGELEPYRRPAQFLLIFNHWLNKKTWYVYDAPGRVPLPKRVKVDLERKRRRKRIVSSEAHEQQQQQQQYQEPASASPTTAVCGHRSTRKSRLESWRTAVNIARRFSGTETFDKEIDQILRSSEPPPDGAMDPASWIIRRPPQGNNNPPRGDTWFEGSGGVLETYENWQRVGKFRCARMKRYFSNGSLFGSNSRLAATGTHRGGLVEGENRKPKRRDGSSGRMAEAFHGIRKMSQSRFQRLPSGAFRRRRNPSNVVGDRCSTGRTGGNTLVASRDISISALLGRSGNSGGCRTVDETNENHAQ